MHLNGIIFEFDFQIAEYLDWSKAFTIEDIIKHTRWVLANTPDEDIDYSDCPELDENDPLLTPVPNPWFLQALKKSPEPKHAITIKLDADLLRWLKSQGKGYQTRINALLRQYMDHQLQQH